MEKKRDMICMGTALVDSIIKGFDPEPVSASGYRAVSGTLNVGGEAVNQAMAAAKLGIRTGILCSLGVDEAGELVMNALQRSGVDTEHVIRDSEHPTPVTTMFVREDGTRKSITNQAHRYGFAVEKYEDVFTDTRALLLGSLFRAPFDEPERIRYILKKAKDAGVLVFADTKLPNYKILGLEELREVLPMIDYITPNEDEAAYYTKEKEPSAMADVFLKYGVKNVLIKLGRHGCYFKNSEQELSLPAYRINAVDATGAGDNFLAGFAAEILRGASKEQALRFGNACGAICATMVGAGSALKSREQVLQFMRENALSV
ncbi:MAG: carbohydrate kinase family protein [Lachnospiraceae bacterium]|nr:carbohydrate kinase family protein [Lachnospiraceae bacterium]